ncbi:UrcA family protein [Phenylobacterium sp.]|uniref:UrcA family protein n=1 Tax=Phenylobacterium sp. TaxID=1871053 RepID=UPI003568E8B6
MTARYPFPALAVLAAVGFTACAGPTFAAPERSPFDDTLSRTVSVADLNLDSEAGATVALRRIHAAAVYVCGGRSGPVRLDREAYYQACLRIAVDRATPQLHSATAAALNAEGHQPTVLADRR